MTFFFLLTLWHWHWRCIGVGVSRTYRRWLVTLQPCLLLDKLFDCLILLSFITNVLVVRYWASARQTIQRKLRPGSSFNNPPNKKTIFYAWDTRGYLLHAQILGRSSRALLYTRLFSPYPPDVQELSLTARSQHPECFRL